MEYYFIYPKVAEGQKTWGFLIKAYGEDNAWLNIAAEAFHSSGVSTDDYIMVKVKSVKFNNLRRWQDEPLANGTPIIVSSKDVVF